MSPILGLHHHESQAVTGEPNIGEPQPDRSPLFATKSKIWTFRNLIGCHLSPSLPALQPLLLRAACSPGRNSPRCTRTRKAHPGF